MNGIYQRHLFAYYLLKSRMRDECNFYMGGLNNITFIWESEIEFYRHIWAKLLTRNEITARRMRMRKPTLFQDRKRKVRKMISLLIGFKIQSQSWNQWECIEQKHYIFYYSYLCTWMKVALEYDAWKNFGEAFAQLVVV